MFNNKSVFKINDSSNIPPSRPPNITPLCCKCKKKFDAESLKPYINSFIYVWLINGSSFWMYPKSIKNNMLCGYIWIGESWETICIGFGLIQSIY